MHGNGVKDFVPGSVTILCQTLNVRLSFLTDSITATAASSSRRVAPCGCIYTLINVELAEFKITGLEIIVTVVM